MIVSGMWFAGFLGMAILYLIIYYAVRNGVDASNLRSELRETENSLKVSAKRLNHRIQVNIVEPIQMCPGK